MADQATHMSPDEFRRYGHHNPNQVVKLCELGLVLSAGQLQYFGAAAEAVKLLGYDYEDEEPV